MIQMHMIEWILQVVAAVAFKGKRLEIPSEVNHHMASLIEACWAKWVEDIHNSFVKLSSFTSSFYLLK